MRRLFFLAVAAAIATFASAAEARRLADVFAADLEGLGLAPVGVSLGATLAATYPVASASASVTYGYNPALETFERRAGVLGPMFGERAETVGGGQINASLGYTYVSLSSINGDSLDELENKPVVNGEIIFQPIPGGVQLGDGRFTNFLPVRIHGAIDVEAQLLTPGVTYGITPDLDINVTLPLVRTFVRVSGSTELPDPRLPQFALAQGTSLSPRENVAAQSAEGVGDLLLRAKYTLLRDGPVDVATQLAIALPTGDEKDFHGTGTTRVAPTLILSKVFAERIQPLLNVGINLNADDVSRSVVRWAAGVSAQVVGPLTASVVFLARHELAAQADQIRNPFFLQIERNDIYDASIGLRWLFLDSGVVSANAIVPLNSDGFRADVIPTVQVDYAFNAPW